MKELVVIVVVIGSGYLTKYSCEAHLVKACGFFESQVEDENHLRQWAAHYERDYGSRKADHRSEITSRENSFNAIQQSDDRSIEPRVSLKSTRIVVFVDRE